MSGIAAAHDTDSRINYLEPLRINTSSSSIQQKSTQSRELQFDAYGRRFVVTLEPNDTLSPLLQTKPGSTTTSNIELYRGQVNGDARSWARISILNGKYQGMLWDGEELYVIEPLSELRDALPANTPVDDETSAIFRLADVSMKPGTTSCGTDSSGDFDKGSDAFQSIVSELKGTPGIMQSSGPTRRLELSVLGDMLLVERFGSDNHARNQLLQRLNNVDGIYSSQLGVRIAVSSIDFGDSLSPTTSPSSLLNELGDLRRRSPILYQRGLTHLFTGRDLDGTTVGIAFINSVCDRQYGAGLTEARNRSLWTESLIAAHEIGHNFGAPHDGDPDEACASTPVGLYLMSASINGSDDFSSCSLGIMKPRAASADCVTALPDADIAVDSNLGSARHALNKSFDWQVTVRNVGGLATTGARAEITLPTALSVEEAFVSGGTCTSGGGVVSCEIGAIDGGNAVNVQLVLRSLVATTHAVSVNVTATNDSNTSNNQGSGTISTQPEVDLTTSLQAPASASTGTPFNIALSATNQSSIDASGVTLTLTLPNGVIASAASLNGGSCTAGGSSIACSLATLAAGANVTGSATLIANMPGSTTLLAQVASEQVDPVSGNDSATATVNVTGVAITASQSSSSGGGGGGTTGPDLLALLLALLGLKSLHRRPLAG